MVILGKCSLLHCWLEVTPGSLDQGASPSYDSPAGVRDTGQVRPPAAEVSLMGQASTRPVCGPLQPLGLSTDASRDHMSGLPSSSRVGSHHTLICEKSRQWNLLQEMTPTKGGFVTPGEFYKSL